MRGQSGVSILAPIKSLPLDLSQSFALEKDREMTQVSLFFQSLGNLIGTGTLDLQKSRYYLE